MIRRISDRRSQRRRALSPAAIVLAAVTLAAMVMLAPPTGDAYAQDGAWSQRSIAGMSVELYEPSTAATLPGGRALMVSLHGCVQTSQVLKSGGNWVDTADDHGMVVAIPAAPGGGVLLGCWDYYDSNHSRTNPARHDDNLLDLVDQLLADMSLNIDPDQVYITGLSSGGGQAMVMGCLAPDVFAGVGINAGPTVGTTAGQIGYVATNLAQGRSTCETFAGEHEAGFDTQVTSVIYDSGDTTVAPGYNPLNAAIMADLYGATSESTFSLSGLPGTNTNGSGTLHSDADGPRVSLIQNSGLGHAWPAGEGPGGAYVSTNSIDYPSYVTAFFFDSNRRVDRGDPDPDPDPDVDPPEVTITAPADGATVSGTVQVAVEATDDVAVDRVDVDVDGISIGSVRAEPYVVDWETSTFDAGDHQLTARAVDTSGNAATASITVTVAADSDPLCIAATNAEHKAEGRAISYGIDPYNPYYARGSMGYMGLGDATVSALRETSPGWFQVVNAC